MKQVLYVSSLSFSEETKGGTVVAKRNFNLFVGYYGLENVHPYRLECFKYRREGIFVNVINILRGFYNLITLRGNGCSKSVENDIMDKIRDYKIDIVVVEASLNGRMIRRIRNEFGILVFSFFHNCEVSLLRKNKSIVDLIRLPFVFFSECLTCKYANYLIALSSRDDSDIYKLYGRRADFIFPITLSKPEYNIDSSVNFNRSYCLFVGSDFHPNNEGIVWFIKNVSPYISLDTYILGSCCQYVVKKNQKLPSFVHLLGTVENVSIFYRNASCVVIPVFKGSGMKTKTVEAMSYSKTIFGTYEAFVGIDGDYAKMGGLCNSVNDFIDKISSRSLSMENEYVSDLFFDKYETDRVKNRFFEFLNNIC